MIRQAIVVTWLALVPILGASPATAGWPHDPSNGNVVLCEAFYDQFDARMVSDGEGGAIVVWHDQRFDVSIAADIYVQRVSAAGVPKWTADGVALCITSMTNQSAATIAADGVGGAIVAWTDFRTGSADIYAQRVNADGVPQWTANGVALCTAGNWQDLAAIASDGAGGAIVAWQDPRIGSTDIYAQRVDAAGVPQWTANGVAVCAATNAQFNPTIVPDGEGGAFVAWQDHRPGTHYDIYAQRVNSLGTPQWAANGIALCVSPLDQTIPIIAPAGSYGAIVTWKDSRSGPSDIYAQRVSPEGTPLWTANGVALCTAANVQDLHHVVSDGSGGAVVTWQDLRGGTTKDIYAQRVSGTGVPQWTADGVVVCAATNEQESPSVAADGTGGAIVTWSDFRDYNITFASDVYAQRVNAAGVPQWTADGVPVSTALHDQTLPVIIADELGGAVLAWQDARGPSYYFEIYAQRIDRFGQLGAQPTIASIRDVPNDQGGRVKISWDPSPLDALPTEGIASYQIFRSVPPNSIPSTLRSGAVPLGAMPGLLATGERRLFTTATAAGTIYWEIVASVPSNHLPGYSYLAPTATDSVAGSNPKTLFMVEALSPGGTMFWFSDPDSAYSVDNVSPAPPAAFTAQYIRPAGPSHALAAASGGFTWFHWNPSADPDFLEYRLHRGTSAGFVPGPANLITAQPDTGYQDVGPAGGHYKLLSVDVHGNWSESANLGPNEIVNAPLPPTPGTLWLAPASPNPASQSVLFRLGLPREADATLVLYDAGGRLVRHLVSSRLPAGEQTFSWDTRDDHNRPVAGGVYFASLLVGGETRRTRVAVIR